MQANARPSFRRLAASVVDSDAMSTFRPMEVVSAERSTLSCCDTRFSHASAASTLLKHIHAAPAHTTMMHTARNINPMLSGKLFLRTAQWPTTPDTKNRMPMPST